MYPVSANFSSSTLTSPIPALIDKGALGRVLDGAPAAIFVCDRAGTLVYCNDRAVQLCGRRPSLGAEGLDGALCAQSPEGRVLPADGGPLAEALRTGTPTGVVRLRVLRPDGSERWVDEEASPLRGEDGEVLGAVAVAHELDTSSSLSADEATREEFLARIAHELKTPVTALGLQLEAVAQAARAGPLAFGRKLSHVRRMVGRLKHLVEDLLDASAVLSGAIPLSVRTVVVAPAVTATVRRFTPRAQALSVRLRVTQPDDSLAVRADPRRLEQLLAQLLDNALKFGGGNDVEVQVTSMEARVRISVTDHGIGVADSDVARIFRRFERAVSSRHYGGMGLGLWLARELAHSMGGEIVVASRLGAGSTFSVDLPRA